jgi:uncharacterized membrane protein YhaH (DUF805 family)
MCDFRNLTGAFTGKAGQGQQKYQENRHYFDAVLLYRTSPVYPLYDRFRAETRRRGLAEGEIVGFKEAIISCYRNNYAGFSGRASRSEYWFFVLSYVLVATALSIPGLLLGNHAVLYVCIGLLFLAIFLPSLAAQVRRLHDTNSSGWWLLLLFIPYVGSFIMLVWFCIPGTKGSNRFGPDPLNPTDIEVFE